MRGTYGSAEAPERIVAHAVDSSNRSVDRVELNAEDDLHAGLAGFDVEAVADRTEVGNVELNDVGDFGKVGRGEVPHGIVGVGFDDDGKLDLAFKLVQLGSVLRLGDDVLVAGDVLDSEAVLLEDDLAFGGIAQVVVAEVDATSVQRHTCREALVLDKVSMRHMMVGSDTYQLHLMLDAEELELGVGASRDTIRQPGDELVARDEGGVVLVQLIGEGALEVGDGERKSTTPLGGEVASMVLGPEDSKLVDTLTMAARVGVADQVG